MEEALEGGETVLSNTLACNVHRKPVFSFSVLGELKSDQVGVTLSDGSENHPGSPHVRLTPLLLLSIKVLETHDTLVEHFEPASVVDVIPFGFSARAKDLEGLWELDQMESHRISSALLVSTVKLAKFLRPGLTVVVWSRDVLAGKWVLYCGRVPIFLAVGIKLEKFAGTVTKQFMQGDDNCQCARLVSQHHIHIRFW